MLWKHASTIGLCGEILLPSEMKVKPKKRLGQHFLQNDEIARQIADAIQTPDARVLEIGPGMGILTRHLLQKSFPNLSVIELDKESIAYLQAHFPQLGANLIEGDFLKFDINGHYPDSLVIVGNFPYNISSQILFKVLDHKDKVLELVGMFQKEVAERVSASAGNRQYGILSVLLQAFYDIEYLFTVSENEFSPPPKVKSAVVRLTRNSDKKLHVDEGLFHKIVKTAFNHRRKTLRNALLSMGIPEAVSDDPIFTHRAEQLTVQDYEYICNLTLSSHNPIF